MFRISPFVTLLATRYNFLHLNLRLTSSECFVSVIWSLKAWLHSVHVKRWFLLCFFRSTTLRNRFWQMLQEISCSPSIDRFSEKMLIRIFSYVMAKNVTENILCPFSNILMLTWLRDWFRSLHPNFWSMSIIKEELLSLLVTLCVKTYVMHKYCFLYRVSWILTIFHLSSCWSNTNGFSWFLTAVEPF